MAGRVEYTIDELAREAGTTVRSLRVYHERGVLPPPRVKGRTGFYGAEHLNRVRTISRLLDRGIKLNGIKELLAAWDRGDDLGDVLGVSESSAEPAASAATEDTIAATELAQRYSAVPNGLARVVAAGLYEPVDASTYRPADRTLIRVLEQMEAAGIPVDDMLAELEKLRTDADRVARRFVELFHRTVWQEYQRSEQSAADRAELTESLDVAKVVPGQVTGELVNRFVARYFDEDTEFAEL
ncbi:MerR family transcriptional regulator [Nocardia cyriacigeorgica]|uniref:MerR family transcriptional regulator n=1 Tax=Nocardia cyriacigeorgica TaxID=135487 RepID=UPI0018949A9A|nr:MerR family transcriptional regulator [Nocardia cyriacigeorgica]MBF6455897.1 MerR family transcriptional regulator [Nocardia cyriacigeorgica]MBF6477463.1 MerR family transcriptional regulator [Nocardia cyriacigeorgica]MBF6553362.1 MerR family transcriptional regulator [Nocardia cyriacigeorgica]